MCAQCMAGATTAMAGATGARAFIAARYADVMTPRRLAFVTRGLLALAVLAAAFGGSAAS